VVRAVLRDGAVTLQFHTDAKVDVQRLLTLVRKGNGRFTLAADFQFSFRAEATDWDGLVAETKAVLRDLQETC